MRLVRFQVFRKSEDAMLGHRGGWWLPVVIVAVGGMSLLPAQEPAAKKPVPDERSLEQALTLVKEVYGDEFKRAKDVAQKTALAEKLLQKAKESAADPTGRFALLRVAKDIAALAGDADVALRAVDDMALTFAIEVFPAKAETLLKAAQSARHTKQHVGVATQAAALIEAAVQQDDFDIARTLSRTAIAAARRSGDSAILKKSVTRDKEVEAMATTFATVKDSFAKLKMDPVDPDANLAVGRYYCLLKGDWEKGTSCLALGNDEQLKALASKELKDVSDTDGQVALGDGWWELASASEGAAQEQLQKRAAYWYRKALPNSAGFSKDKVEKRLEQCATGRGFGTPPSIAGRTSGRLVTALAFDGKSSFVTSPHVSFDELSVFTVEAWLMGWNGEFIDEGKPGDPENQFTILRRPDKISLFWEHGRGAAVGRDLPAVRPKGWEHLAVVLDNGTLCVFSNGRLVHREERLPRPGLLVKQHPLVIGANQITKRIAPTATGLLRAMRISSVARYRDAFTPEADWPPDDGTILLWSVARTQGNLLLDASKNKAHGKANAVGVIRVRDDL